MKRNLPENGPNRERSNMNNLDERQVSIFWDNSNVFVPAIDVAKERDGAIVGHSLRIHFANLFELARAGRRVNGGYCVGTTPIRNPKLEERLAGVGIGTEFFERGRESGGEQAVDQALQVHMLRSLVDMAPGIAVLLTGDGAGAGSGRGYLADLQRMYRGGWEVEVLSWRDACHRGLRSWSEEHGHFVALDDYYESVTFLEGLRFAKALNRVSRPFRRSTVTPASAASAAS
jgi:hypothetical protein